MRAFVFFVSCLAASVAVAQKPALLFSVGATEVPADEFVHIYQKNHANQPEAFTEPKVNEYLNLYINFKLKVTEARARGLDTTAKFRNEFKTYREDLRKPFTATPDALDKATRETYERLREEVKAAHILFRLPDSPGAADTLAAWNKCQAAQARLQAGEDFYKLASELSEDPSAKYNRGDLGFFTAMQMVYPFEKAAYDLPPGQVSKPVRTRFGYHLIKVESRQPARGEVEVSHILLRKTGTDDKALRDKIFMIDEQLRKGRPWEEVCKEFSEDVNTKDAGGKLRPFGVGALASVPEFETMAFALREPGQRSDPFSSNIGWHIVRLEKKIPLPPYAELEASLKKRVARDERLQASRKWVDAQRKKTFLFSEEPAVKEKVLALADTLLVKGQWTYRGASSLLSERLFTVSGQPRLVKNFVAFVLSEQKQTPQSPALYMAQLYETFVEGTLATAEEEKLVKEKPEFRHLLTEYREGILLFEIMEQEVWNKASEDSAGLAQFYASNREKYRAGERTEARIFSHGSVAELDVVEAKIRTGDTLTVADTQKLKSAQPWRKFEPGENEWVDMAGGQPGPHR
ncbi:MAG: peptidylprolyl isomerase, partial [Cyclobacteriaceae bacterium]|nr:peptidylprolyl isomerase [Cyclobacteriaceae bacterium]